MSNYTLTGVIAQIGAVNEITPKFKKREIVLEFTETLPSGQNYTHYFVGQATNNKCAILDPFKVGDNVTCHFNIRGSKSEKNGQTKYYCGNEIWRLEKA